MVGIVEVVAHVEVGVAVAVDVVEPRRQGEVRRLLGEGSTILVEEPLPRGRDRAETAGPVIEVQRVGLRSFQPYRHGRRPPHLESVVLRELRDDLVRPVHPANHAAERAFRRRQQVANGGDLVVGGVEVEVAVVVDVGEGHGGGAAGGGEAAGGGGVGEVAGAVVEEQAVGAAQGGEQQVEVAVAVDVGEHGAGGEALGGGHAAGGGGLGEAPGALVEVEGVGALDAGEVEVGPAVGVHIPNRHPRAVHQEPVLERAGLADPVDEVETGPGSVELGEAGAASVGHRQLPPAVAALVMPGLGDGLGARSRDRQHQGSHGDRGEDVAASHGGATVHRPRGRTGTPGARYVTPGKVTKYNRSEGSRIERVFRSFFGSCVFAAVWRGLCLTRL